MDNTRTYYDNISICCICDKHQDHTVLDMQANKVRLLKNRHTNWDRIYIKGLIQNMK